MKIFRTNESALQELNLADNSLTDRNIEELSSVFKNERRLCLESLNLSQNPKCRPLAIANLLSALSSNSNVPISRLYLNGSDLDVSPKTATTVPGSAWHLSKAFVTLLT